MVGLANKQVLLTLFMISTRTLLDYSHHLNYSSSSKMEIINNYKLKIQCSMFNVFMQNLKLTYFVLYLQQLAMSNHCVPSSLLCNAFFYFLVCARRNRQVPCYKQPYPASTIHSDTKFDSQQSPVQQSNKPARCSAVLLFVSTCVQVSTSFHFSGVVRKPSKGALYSMNVTKQKILYRTPVVTQRAREWLYTIFR